MAKNTSSRAISLPLAMGCRANTPRIKDWRDSETESLQSLMRGVFARQPIAKGSEIAREDVFFAMPWQPGSLSSGEWEPGLVADKDYAPLKPINVSLAKLEVTDEERVYSIMLQVKGMLNKARIFLGKDSSLEVSHHYGLERFREFGCIIINCIN